MPSISSPSLQLVSACMRSTKNLDGQIVVLGFSYCNNAIGLCCKYCIGRWSRRTVSRQNAIQLAQQALGHQLAKRYRVAKPYSTVKS